MADRTFKSLLEETRQQDTYHVEGAIIQFTSDLHQLMKNRGLNKAELARILGKSPAYITKVFRGDANFTIESMIRLGRAVGGRLRLALVADSESSFAREAPSAYRARNAKVPVSHNSRARGRSAPRPGK